MGLQGPLVPGAWSAPATAGDRLADDNGLTPVRLGRADQPAAGSGTDADRYAADPLRPQYHFTPYQGWINDPVGLIEWRGQHHLFYQSYPHAPFWSSMHWGHAVGADPVRWRTAPTALVPPPRATPGDVSGVFSGSAVDDGGVLTLVYTQFTDPVAHPGAVAETVGIATSTDGVHFTPYAANPVIAAPPPGSGAGFRDPKVFRDPADGSWKLVIGSGDGGRGSVQLYSSPDLRQWTYRGVLFAGDGSTGPMWECPDLFRIASDWVLIVSADNRTHYWVGSYDGTRFTPRRSGLVDAGPDFYAAQHYRDASGRDLLIGWMGHWGAQEPARVNGWAGAHSITRELFVRPDGALGSRPVAEVASLRSAPPTVLRRPVTAGPGRLELPGAAGGDTLDLQVDLDLARTSATAVTLDVRRSAAEATAIRYDTARGELTLDSRRSGYGDCGTWTTAVRPDPDGVLRLRVLLDRSSVEVFAGGGEALTARIYPRYRESVGWAVTAEGGAATVVRAAVAPVGSAWR